jgi:hypothetical protein
MPSNCLIVNGEKVAVPASILDLGCRAYNFIDDGEPNLRNAPRTKPVQHLVLHETAGNSATGCKDTLRQKKIGVHLILGKNGDLSCHADLATDVCFHGNQLNATSVGIEVVNPYRPEYARNPRGPVLPAQWWTWVPPGHERTYQAPLGVQVAIVKALVPWLCEVMGIPYEFPTKGLNAKARQIAGWKAPPLGWYAKPGPGVVAHRDYASHSDGRYLLEQVMGGTLG